MKNYLKLTFAVSAAVGVATYACSKKSNEKKQPAAKHYNIELPFTKNHQDRATPEQDV